MRVVAVTSGQDGCPVVGAGVGDAAVVVATEVATGVVVAVVVVVGRARWARPRVVFCVCGSDGWSSWAAVRLVLWAVDHRGDA